MILFIIFLVLIFLGLPIALALGVVPFGYFLITEEYPLTLLACQMYAALDNFTLIAVPLFILGGAVITRVGVTEKLVNFSNEMVGRLTGGLSHINVLVSTLFGGLNGSAVGDAAAVGSILIKPMVNMGFGRAFSAAVTAASGTISGIIPPSIPFIIFATAVPGVSIGALFIGGIVPGVLVCVFQCLAGYLISKQKKYPKVTTPFTWGAFGKATLEAIPALVLVFIIIFGLRSGVFTPTEVAAIIVVYALGLGFLFYRNLNYQKFMEALFEATITTGIIFMVIAFAGPFMWLLTRMGVTDQMTASVTHFSTNYFLWWLAVGLFVLIAGMIMDTVANILILSPIIYQASCQLGFDPFVTSIATVMLLIIGTTSPPVGISLFVTSSIAKVRIERTSLYVMPFIAAELIVVAFVLACPNAIKYLPRLFGYEV